MLELIIDCWSGREKLWKVFWLYGVLLGLVLEFISNIFPANAIGLILFFILNIPWVVWNTVSQWRCAYNTEFEFLGHIVRGIIIIGLIALAVMLITVITS